jgi:hypothetical protein
MQVEIFRTNVVVIIGWLILVSVPPLADELVLHRHPLDFRRNR